MKKEILVLIVILGIIFFPAIYFFISGIIESIIERINKRIITKRWENSGDRLQCQIDFLKQKIKNLPKEERRKRKRKKKKLKQEQELERLREQYRIKKEKLKEK